MPNIEAFRGIRYNLGHVGSLSDVIAPPYDVIDGDLQTELYKKHPSNVVRLILNRAEPGDSGDERYERASSFLKNWQRDGVLQVDAQAAVYVYTQTFIWGDQEFTRGGFMARVRLEPFGKGKIYPHEETHSAAKVDRLKLFNACKANLSQVFGLFPDEANEVRTIIDEAIQGVAPLEATDHLGIVHRMWPITDVQKINDLTSAMGSKPIFIADGHHRYETACSFQAEKAAANGGELPSNDPANFVLMMCVGMSDPGMIVLPTHRLFRGIPEIDSEELSGRLADCFDVRVAGEGPDLASTIWDQIEMDDDQGTIGLYAGKDDRWVVAKINDAGRERMATIAGEHSTNWQGLGVSILHRLIIDTLLGATDLPKPMYVHSVDEVIQGLEAGDTVGRDATGQEGQGGKFPLAALVMPASLDHVREISELGERMPAKSTYFFPKLLSGLVINSLE